MLPQHAVRLVFEAATEERVFMLLAAESTLVEGGCQGMEGKKTLNAKR